MKNFEQIKALVGNVTEDQLKYVDCYVCDGFGVFVPSVGFCAYAIQEQHIHPSYSGIIIPSKSASEGVLPCEVFPDEYHYVGGLLSPGVTHEEKPQDTFQRYFALMISKERFEAACAVCKKEILPLTTWQQFLIPKTVTSWVNAFMHECEINAPEQQEVASHWATIIIYEMIRAGIKKQEKYTMFNPNAQVEDIRQYIHQNFGEPLTVGGLSKLANMSESNFSRRFKLETGQTPAKYLHTVRLEKARKFLHIKDYSVTDVALACGFTGVSHFSKSFKNAYGISPIHFKNTCL